MDNEELPEPHYLIRRTPDAEFEPGIAATLEGTLIKVRESIWPTLTPSQQRRVVTLRQPTLSLRDLTTNYLSR